MRIWVIIPSFELAGAEGLSDATGCTEGRLALDRIAQAMFRVCGTILVEVSHMQWIVWLVVYLFPMTVEWGTSREVSMWVMRSGEYGSPGEVVALARKECESLDGCGPR